MRPDAEDRLYLPLDRTYRPRATLAQIAVIMAALALSMGAITAHYDLVFRPSQTDFTLASMPYRPWYLAQEEAAPGIGAKELADGHQAAATEAGHADSPLAAAPAQSVEPARPNLVPQPGVSYNPSNVAGRIEAYLNSKGARASKEDMAATAQKLAAAYASSSEAGIATFPFSTGLERSVLEQGWLWELREGCEPQVYLKFPASQLDKMGCGLAGLPRGSSFGVGVALVEDKGTGQRLVIAVVWDNK